MKGPWLVIGSAPFARHLPIAFNFDKWNRTRMINYSLEHMYMIAIHTCTSVVLYIANSTYATCSVAANTDTEMSVVPSCSCLCPIHLSQVLCREWRCSWSSTGSNYIWVINNFSGYTVASYIRGLKVTTANCMPRIPFPTIMLPYYMDVLNEPSFITMNMLSAIPL